MGGYYGRSSGAPNGLNPGQRRDSRRQRLYDAEKVLRGLRVSTLAKRHLTDSQRSSTERVWVKADPADEHASVTVLLTYPHAESVQDYVDAMFAAAWFRRRWGFVRMDVSHSHGRGSHATGHSSIAMGTEHRRSESVILHEVAHNLTARADGAAAWHGPEFAGVLLTLVKFQMGAEHARTLRESFKAHGVRYTMECVPDPDEDRRARADALAKRRGVKPRTTARHKPIKVGSRKPPKRIETAEEMEEVGRRAALRGSDWDRAESAALSRATGDLRYEGGRRAFSRGFGAVRDAVSRGEIDDPMR